MVPSKLFRFISDSKILVRLYNPKTDYEGVMNVLHEAYMKDSNTFHTFELNKPEAVGARLEFKQFINSILKDGLSMVACHIPTHRITGFCINTMYSRPEPGCLSMFEEFRDTNIHSKELMNFFNYRILTDKHLDLFNKFNADNIFECVYVATHSCFRCGSIAYNTYNLIDCSIELAKNLADGLYPIGMDESLRGKIPKIVYGNVRPKYVARIAGKLGCIIVESTPFNEVMIDAIPVSSRILPQHTHNRKLVLKI